MDTKACNLTEDEIKTLILCITYKFSQPDANINDLMERLNYLHKRLKAFNEVETKPIPTPIPQPAAWPNN